MQKLQQDALDGRFDAMNRLGMLWRTGHTVEQDFHMARYWYERAVDGGFSPAFSNLGALYEQGVGVATDLDKAEMLYRQAAAVGHERGSVNLASLLLGLGKDVSFALELLKQFPANPRALFLLGRAYESGFLVVRDTSLSHEYFVRSAELGYAKAIKRLSQLNQHRK